MYDTRLKQSEIAVIEISERAQSYLQDLLAKQEDDDVGIRVFVAQPGTPQAETCIAYCRPGEAQDDDVPYEYEGFRAWVEERSRKYLEDAVVDFQDDRMGGQLTIKAPNCARTQRRCGFTLGRPHQLRALQRDQSRSGRPCGMVTLVEVLEDNVAVLQFGGGCQGCAAVDITLKHGVESSLLQQIPELAGIKDATTTPIPRTPTTNSRPVCMSRAAVLSGESVAAAGPRVD